MSDIDLSDLPDGAPAWSGPVRRNFTALDTLKAEQADMLNRLCWRGNFANSTTYAVNDLVVANSSNLYRCMTAHTSASTGLPALNGDSTYWQRLAGSASVTLDTIPAGTVISVTKVGGVWPGGTSSTGIRPTARTDLKVLWCGPAPFPAVVTSGTGGMLQGMDHGLVTV